jgi:hypothetical protein
MKSEGIVLPLAPDKKTDYCGVGAKYFSPFFINNKNNRAKDILPLRMMTYEI